MARQRANLCTCCTSFITSTGVTLLFLWLTLRTQHPKLFIQNLYLPSLNKTITSHNNKHPNNTIIFQLKLTNQNKDKGIQYDTIHLTFNIFFNVNTTRPLSNSTLDSFYQGHGKTTEKWGLAEARGDKVKDMVDGKVFIRVEFVTRVKYKILLFYTKRHRLFGGGNVEVDVGSGEKVGSEGVRLGNVPPRIGSEAASVRGYSGCLARFFVSLLFFTIFT